MGSVRLLKAYRLKHQTGGEGVSGVKPDLHFLGGEVELGEGVGPGFGG